MSSEELVQRAHARGLALTPGSAHAAMGAVAAFRFGFAAHTSEELSKICDTLEACLQSGSGSKRR
ncbi:hypothetical protein WMF39_35825 [Sorangium sp. So ce1504]|uniref:hypothetical protein n=1 Tax=Sorangium sp. So ce1504 TaxID=3133337 RepID=UPI003F61F463